MHRSSTPSGIITATFRDFGEQSDLAPLGHLSAFTVVKIAAESSTYFSLVNSATRQLGNPLHPVSSAGYRVEEGQISSFGCERAQIARLPAFISSP